MRGLESAGLAHEVDHSLVVLFDVALECLLCGQVFTAAGAGEGRLLCVPVPHVDPQVGECC